MASLHRSHYGPHNNVDTAGGFVHTPTCKMLTLSHIIFWVRLVSLGCLWHSGLSEFPHPCNSIFSLIFMTHCLQIIGVHLVSISARLLAPSFLPAGHLAPDQPMIPAYCFLVFKALVTSLLVHWCVLASNNFQVFTARYKVQSLMLDVWEDVSYQYIIFFIFFVVLNQNQKFQRLNTQR